jgi:hypothetical protein
MRENISNIGYLEYLEKFGDETTILNSYYIDTNITELNDINKKTLYEMCKSNNFSYFHHVIFRFKIHGPILTMLQLHKYITSFTPNITWTEILTNENTTAIWTCSLLTVFNFIKYRAQFQNNMNLYNYTTAMISILQKIMPTIFNLWFNSTICK